MAIVASPATRAQKPALNVPELTKPPPSIASNNAIALQQKSKRWRTHDGEGGAGPSSLRPSLRKSVITDLTDLPCTIQTYSTGTGAAQA
jgi:hypothetical protein